jgi:3-oxoacyl-[acyl-carrier protein] reductase
METSYMDLQLTGKTAVVTGASMGLGRAIAKSLAAEGVTVFAVSRTEELLKSLAEEIVAIGGATPIIMAQDFVAPEGPRTIASEALKALGHVDILINCAGGSRPTTWNASDEEWEEGFTLNFERHRQLTQELLPQMVERRSGRVINICGSIELRQVNTAGAAKAALVVWSKGLSHEMGKYGVTVNCVEPGLIDTAQIRRLFPGDARRQYAEQHISLGDFGEPEDVGAATAFLASGPAAYITGIVLGVDGGMRYRSF